MRAAWLALACACAPIVDQPVPPASPIIHLPASSMADPWVDPTVTMTIEAADGTVIMLFVNAECAGLPLERVPIERFRDGVELDVVHGPNVFSAKAIDTRGVASSCSDPVTFEVARPSRGMEPPPRLVRVEPPVPTTALSVRLIGTAAAGFRVRVWSAPNCKGTVLATGLGFGLEGLRVDLQRDAVLTVSIDGARGNELTQCSGPLTLENDLTPPELPDVHVLSALELQPEMYGVVANDAEGDTYSLGLVCGGATGNVGIEGVCAGLSGSVCHRVLDLSRPGPEELPLTRSDRAGNSVCARVTRHVPDAGTTLVLAAISGRTSLNLYALTTDFASSVHFYRGPSCGDPALPADLQPTPNLFVKVGQLFGQWSARTYDLSGQRDAGPCVVAQ